MRDFIVKALLTYDFSYIDNKLPEDSDLSGVLQLMKDVGASGYRLMRVVGISVTFIALLIACIMLFLSSNGRAVRENFKKIARIVVGMCGIFAFLGILAILLSIAYEIRT